MELPGELPIEAGNGAASSPPPASSRSDGEASGKDMNVDALLIWCPFRWPSLLWWALAFMRRRRAVWY